MPASVEKSPPAARRSGSSSKGGPVKFPDHVEFKYDGDTPIAYAPMECAELVWQIRGGVKDMPPIKDLIFKDTYVDAARTKVLVRIAFLVLPLLFLFLVLTFSFVCAERRERELRGRDI